MSDTKELIRSLIDDSPKRNLSELSRDTGVPFWPLYDWYRRKTEKLDVTHAEAIHLHLTGKPLTDQES